MSPKKRVSIHNTKEINFNGMNPFSFTKPYQVPGRKGPPSENKKVKC